MLRICLLRQWFNLSDPGVEEAVYGLQAMRRFVGIDRGREPVPDETTVCRFRHLLEEHDLGRRLWLAIRPIIVIVDPVSGPVRLERGVSGRPGPMSKARRPARPAVPMVGAWEALEAPAPRAVQTPADPAVTVWGETRQSREARQQGERPAAVTHLPHSPEGLGV
jgi:Transposase domain (DUF772)